jgi:hypothetical protein
MVFFNVAYFHDRFIKRMTYPSRRCLETVIFFFLDHFEGPEPTVSISSKDFYTPSGSDD